MQANRFALLWKVPIGVEDVLRRNIPGWTFANAKNIAELNTFLGRSRYGVALFHYDWIPEPADLHELEHVLAKGRNVHWIGLLSSQVMAHTPLRRLVSSYAYDFHTLPADTRLLAHSMGHALGMAALVDEAKKPYLQDTSIPEIVGTSAAIDNVRKLVHALSDTQARVLVTGESGTGKEVVARAIHKLSVRAKGPFIAVNCGAFPEGLVQSELFGYRKGSFTGATADKVGRIEAANGGTLFLDEIGDLPKMLQVYLLRFLEEGAIEKIGEQRAIPVDVRVIAATHVDLVKAVAQGSFREDLFYRLNVVRINLPPLRERAEDIPLLAEYFLERYNGDGGRRVRGFTPAAMELMCTYRWPGNVRELVNCIRRAILLSKSRMIGPAELGLSSGAHDIQVRSLANIRESADKRAIEATLRLTGNNVSAASRALKISRLSLYRLMEKYQIRPSADAWEFQKDEH